VIVHGPRSSGQELLDRGDGIYRMANHLLSHSHHSSENRP